MRQTKSLNKAALEKRLFCFVYSAVWFNKAPAKIFKFLQRQSSEVVASMIFLFLKVTAKQIRQISVHVMKKKFLEVITNLRPSKKLSPW